ncbi:type II secretion system F family protein [Pseudoalteromonas sp. SCSIO 43201]|uniref:type II secretion system F family protein n=1 Tax=Pseudoalteromonas TaxID=53246 RepID=UPI0020751F28|nr:MULTISPECIES: type II secretion system F family protein [Pseudoalteromonas]MDW7549402.1 type II secretion system F family protein [Pseudoalteromonas peptidolytica]USD29054.1 type II secretion system F family protein [Pseudoalteromonas sp. SCSIO 43201]
MEFEYKAIDSNGSRHQGTIEANDQAQAQQRLNAEGLSPIEIKAIAKSSSFSGLFTQKVTLDQLEFFTSELSLLLESGVRVDKGIDIIRQSNSDPALGRLLNQIASSIKKGESLSQAFGKHEALFGPLYISLLKIGETSGNLPEVLQRLAADLKFQKDLKSQVSTALTYPSVIFFVCLMAVYFVLTFIVPKMSGIFTDLSQAPWYTQMIIGVSQFFIDNQLFIIGGAITSLVLGGYALQQPEARNWLYVQASKIPGIGAIITTSERIRFAQSMSMMLEAGLQLDTTLALTAETLKHPDFKRDAKQALKQLKSGKQLGVVLSKTRIFPDFFLSIIKVGEETGQLPKVFNEVANRSRTDLEQVISKFTTMLEPIMLLFMGGFVGGIVITMLLSMVSINDVPL